MFAILNSKLLLSCSSISLRLWTHKSLKIYHLIWLTFSQVKPLNFLMFFLISFAWKKSEKIFFVTKGFYDKHTKCAGNREVCCQRLIWSSKRAMQQERRPAASWRGTGGGRGECWGRHPGVIETGREVGGNPSKTAFFRWREVGRCQTKNCNIVYCNRQKQRDGKCLGREFWAPVLLYGRVVG